MTREEIFEKLNEVFRDVFDDSSITVSEKTISDDVDGWDSLSHINLVVAVENEFDIKFSMGETQKMKNVGEMADLIISKLQ